MDNNSSLYIPLCNHSAYSLLEGMMPVAKLIKAAKDHGFLAVGLSDTGHLFGALEFSLACKEAKIQPILGCKLCLSAQSFELDRTQSYPFVLYVKDSRGYKNLCKLVSLTTVGQKDILREQLTIEQLAPYTQGLICLSGGKQGILNGPLAHHREEEALFYLRQFHQLFGDRFYIEISRCEPSIYESMLLKWAYDLNIPLVATNEAFYLDPQDSQAHDALRCISQGMYVQDSNRARLPDQYYFKTSQEMAELFKDLPEALYNTLHIAKRCNFFLEPRRPVLPVFPCIENTEETELLHQSKIGFEERMARNVLPHVSSDRHAEIRKIYTERLNYEIERIINMGFAGYFLIVSDLIQWAKKNDIPVGPGRGSGASSLVAWCLAITDLDPIRFGLHFERFLNPERVSMPDFDVDFCQERRDEVIRYVCNKYGKDRVAQIITFGTLQARAVLRDVGRVLQMPYTQVDKICKLIPYNPANPLSLEEAKAAEPQFAQHIKEDEQVAYLVQLSQKLERLYRHASIHAGGIVIGREPLDTQVPLYQDKNALLPATEFSMKYIEKAGLVKFDFLGLKTLTVLQYTVNLLKKRGIKVDLSSLPLDDSKTFALLRQVKTVGIFQIESSGMSNVLAKLQPDHFEELIALVALYRPGPMEDIPRYLACRHGKEKAQYPYACFEDILKETYGVMVYQEQILQIARTLAGYSYGKADLLRRAMAKKVKSEMEQQRKRFVEGTLKNYGGDEKKASLFFDQIARFAGYAFPKAHAAPYALISYQTAYMKANYPVEFMTALLASDIHNTTKLQTFVQEVRELGIALFPPDINHSKAQFSVEALPEGNYGIRYGLAALKNVGVAAMENVCEEREKHGVFKDIYEFVERIDVHTVNKKQMESLIMAGAFDAIAPNRNQCIASLDLLLKYGASFNTKETMLFSTKQTSPPLAEVKSASVFEKLQQEFQAIGFYLTKHPLDGLEFLKEEIVSSAKFSSFIESSEKQAIFKVIGIVIGIKERLSKSGQKFAFLTLSDLDGVYDVTLFSDLLIASKDLLKEGQALKLQISGRLDKDNLRLVVQEIEKLDIEKANVLILDIEKESQLIQVKQYLEVFPEGETSVILRFYEENSYVFSNVLQLEKRYEFCREKKKELRQLLSKCG